ncbi:MAG: hypothetical protein K6G15_12105 [Desulfovibrio sp.]|nr:hypothetical protein [Desulfovibrio sp.]
MSQNTEPQAPPKATAKPQDKTHAAPQASYAELRDITDEELVEKHGFAWNHNIRLILAIGVVIVSAIFLWWMVS